MSTDVCVVTGVGEGTGLSIVRRFAEGGYRVAMLSRNERNLSEYEARIPGARAYPCDVSDLDHLLETLVRVRGELGIPYTLIHNAVSPSFKRLFECELEDLLEIERNFRVNATSLLYMAHHLAPGMVKAGRGSIIVTGNTSAFRGIPTYLLFAPSKAGQRVLTQSLARELGPRGIHAAYINIDAVIDVPWTRDRFYPDKPDGFFIKPDAIADEVYHVAHQDRSSWSFDVEIRPFGEDIC